MCLPFKPVAAVKLVIILDICTLLVVVAFALGFIFTFFYAFNDIFTPIEQEKYVESSIDYMNENYSGFKWLNLLIFGLFALLFIIY